MDRAPPQPIIAIDLLRFLCALLVVGYHVDAVYWLDPSAQTQAALAGLSVAATGNPVTRVGWIGVELFFVISGLVIADSARGSHWRDFLARRALRLVPAAWICATITLAIIAVTGHATPALASAWLRSMAFWPVGEQIDGVYWTLGVECFFYLFVAAAIGNGKSPRRLETVARVIGLASALGWVASVVAPGTMLPVMANATATLLLLPHGVFFALGMMIAVMRDRRIGLRRIALVVLLLATATIEIDAHAAARASAMHASSSAALASDIFLLGVTVLFAAPLLQRRLARWISPESARLLGLMTYPLYLIHQEAGAVVIARLLGDGVPLLLAEALTIAVMLMLAWWISSVAEPWLRGQLKRVLRRRRDPAPDNHPTAFPSAG